MENTFGYTISVSVEGSSHAPYLKMDIRNFPSGYQINHDIIKHDLSLRRPRGVYSTKRIEADRYEIKGLDDGKTSKNMTVIVYNTNTKSSMSL